jgi:histidyl-tRNA synthetase
MKETKVEDLYNRIHELRGGPDSSMAYFARKESLISSVRNLLSGAGFVSADYPVLEPTELFVRKSGGGITGHLYSFIDPGGNKVSLRPEFTSSVIREYLKEPINTENVVKRQYSGPVFRYNDVSTGNRLRQFTQQGCEIIGASTTDFDAEILRLSLTALSEANIKSVTVRLGNVGAIRKLLESYGLSESICLYIFSNIGKLNQSPENLKDILSHAVSLGLVKENELRSNSIEEDGSKEESMELVQSLMAEILSGNTGRRSRSEIVERLLKKNSELICVDVLESSLQDLSGFLRRMAGDYKSIEVKSNNDIIDIEQMKYVSDLINVVGDIGGMEVTFDLDFASQRGLTYYTGFIFDLVVGTASGPLSLGGGGRYDGLVRSLGGNRDVGAVGFAVNVDSILRYPEMIG